MLSRKILVASRFLQAARAPRLRYPSPVIQQFRSYADSIVKVPQMAESISEGTLKQWSKQIGDHVAQDEEIATIETDKVRCIGSVSRRSLVILSDTFATRLMLLSTPLKPVPSKNFSPMRRIP